MVGRTIIMRKIKGRAEGDDPRGSAFHKDR